MTKTEKRIAFVIGILIFFLLKVWIIQIFWNLLMPSIAGFPEISFIQAIGLRILGVYLTLDGSKNYDNMKKRLTEID